MTPDWQGSVHKLNSRRTSQLGPPKLDYRWTYPHLGLMSLKKNMSSCHHSRCELLKNGSLRFSRVQAEDSGNYSLEVFDEDGQLLSKSDFLLIVKGKEKKCFSPSQINVITFLTFPYNILLKITVTSVSRQQQQPWQHCSAGGVRSFVLLHPGHHLHLHLHKEEKKPEYKRNHRYNSMSETA